VIVLAGIGDAAAGDIVNGKKAWGDGSEITGTRPLAPVTTTGQTTVYRTGDDGTYQKGVRERVGAVDRYHVCAVELADRDTRFPPVFGASVLTRSGKVNFARPGSQRVLELRAVDPTALAAGGSHLDPVRPLPQQLDRHAALHRDRDREAAARTGVEIDVRVFDHDFNRCPRVCRRDGQHSQQEATYGQGSKHGPNLRVPGTEWRNIVH